VHGEDRVELFTVLLDVTDADVDCREGRRIVFVDPRAVPGLDLTDMTRALVGTVLSAHPA
jgi:hypothetical protein